MDLIYGAFGGQWGALWVSRHGTSDEDGAWHRVVRLLSPRQVARGVEHVMTHWTGDRPPTPQQFRALAADMVRPYEAVPEDRRIGAVPASPETAKEHLERMRRLVR